MESQKRAEGFIKFAEYISAFIAGSKKDSVLSQAIIKATTLNPWFTTVNIRHSLSAIGEMLEEKNVIKFVERYRDIRSFKTGKKKTAAVIMPSNIPLSGFHDFFCVLLSGNFFLGKCSPQDNILLPVMAETLVKVEPKFRKSFIFSDNLHLPLKNKRPDFFIATGSNNSSRYFEYYFGKYPHIIRKNRNSLAILTGRESAEDLWMLANDIFLYFGLGCRNVSKILIPENYDFKIFFNGIFPWKKVIHHNKYANNYTYHKAVHLMNKEKIWDNGFILLRENPSLSSPVAMLHYEYYRDIRHIPPVIFEDKNQIQCVVTNLQSQVPHLEFVPFGKAQSPRVWDFADGIDTMEFLLN